MTVLVTGGAGYIGSHVVRLLAARGDDVVIVDDMSNGIASRIEGFPLEQVDLAASDAEERLDAVMRKHAVDSVIHFAAKKQVAESVQHPVWYYRQNVGGLANLLSAMERADVRTIVFSSSAAVYGMPDVNLVAEDTLCQPINPYGQTKLIGEWMIDNAMTGSGLSAVKLRYFNVAGAGWPDLADQAVMNLIPIVLDHIEAGRRPVVFGDDYLTPDGTCIRDYVHVKDLAEAHIAALDYLAAGDVKETVFNVGTGVGASVTEVIEVIARGLNNDIDPIIGERRAGDPPRLVADVSRSAAELTWKSDYGLDQIIGSAIRARATST
ncbi:MAG: UDP-glucose 4-epimerase GalE [Microbacterium sp.]